MLVSAIWLWPAVFGVVERVAQVRLQGWDPPGTGELLFQFWDWVAYAIVTPAIFWASGRWPVVRPHVARRFVIHLGFALLFCVVWATVGKLLQLGIMSIVDWGKVLAAISAAGDHLARDVARNVASWILTTIPFGVVVYTTVAGLAHAIGYFAEAREREVQAARLAEQLAGARYAALQAQVNPHFLFNTLNTIAVFVRDGDRTGAVRIIEQLSELLRRTLARHRANEVTLEEELDLVRQYLAIEQARFPDRLRVEWDVPGVAAAGVPAAPSAVHAVAVPSFALQHLAENAVRHGIARREGAGRVRISARRHGEMLEVTVSDDGPGIGAAAVLPGHGIANTRERLAALYGSRASLVVADAPGGGTVATLRVPWREIAREGAGG
jgi:signal transduction histidine kinase